MAKCSSCDCGDFDVLLCDQKEREIPKFDVLDGAAQDVGSHHPALPHPQDLGPWMGSVPAASPSEARCASVRIAVRSARYLQRL